MKSALHKGLYDPATPEPTLNGTKCGACGAVFFPPLGIGCEKCGAEADRLQAIHLAAKGVLHSVATVHLHMGKDMEAPFTVGEVRLDDGPLIRAVMTENIAASAIGNRVSADWAVARVSDEGEESIEPRFKLDDIKP